MNVLNVPFILGVFFFANSCANSGAVAGNNGRKKSSKSSSTEKGDAENLGKDSNAENPEAEETGIETEETGGKKVYDDSEPMTPQNISGAFLVCAPLKPPVGGTASAEESFIGCAMTIDDKNLYDFSAFDAKWIVRDAAGFSLAAEQIEGPKKSYIQRVFKTTSAVYVRTKSVTLTLANKKIASDTLDVKGDIPRTPIYNYPVENDIDTLKDCPVCPQ